MRGGGRWERPGLDFNGNDMLDLYFFPAAVESGILGVFFFFFFFFD
jgi:hypothetical protein